jgi:hypothetical protein
MENGLFLVCLFVLAFFKEVSIFSILIASCLFYIMYLGFKAAIDLHFGEIVQRWYLNKKSKNACQNQITRAELRMHSLRRQFQSRQETPI